MKPENIKTIVCYGDSNTWGQIPRSAERYGRDIRWPSVLQKLLGEEYEVISEGLCGRTFVAVDPVKLHRTGITHLHKILETHNPIDTVIIMLGTNDMKSAHALEGKDIAKHLEETIQFIQSGPGHVKKIPKILVICPPNVIRSAMPPVSEKGKELDAQMIRAVQISKTLPSLYKEVCEKYGCDFLDANAHIKSSDVDGYHLDAPSHVKLAEVLSSLPSVK